ncbi:hypothetical protein HPB48_019142 [Haemaphysalis longicornis]|uniref:Uncharacterized protein n=1 Tax=Haemaphysalis longicornis TaxID=44386 RepID=A0A9J6GBM6_HAELO|nr:hypothetical protein HPB48_019142 [Haemaphysalis longicornis]
MRAPTVNSGAQWPCTRAEERVNMCSSPSAAFFLASLYAYFDRDSSGSTTSSNTWLVYLVLNFQTVLMVASLLLFFVGSVGFLGALRENICLLELYVTMQAVFTAMYTLLILLIFFLPLIGRGFVLSHITPDLILHYRDSDDFRQVISSRKALVRPS